MVIAVSGVTVGIPSGVYTMGLSAVRVSWMRWMFFSAAASGSSYLNVTWWAEGGDTPGDGGALSGEDVGGVFVEVGEHAHVVLVVGM